MYIFLIIRKVQKRKVKVLSEFLKALRISLVLYETVIKIFEKHKMLLLYWWSKEPKRPRLRKLKMTRIIKIIIKNSCDRNIIF